MTEKDYINKNKFPLTTQDGLDYSKQKMIDSFNYDSLIECLALDEKLSEDQENRLQEFEIKLGRNRTIDVANYFKNAK